VINVKVGIGVGVSKDDEIGSFGSWNMETAIVFRSKFVHISSIFFVIKSPYFYKVSKRRF
jgi:hypothetical protein